MRVWSWEQGVWRDNVSPRDVRLCCKVLQNQNFLHVHCCLQATGESIVGLTVDLEEHYMFWTDLGPTSRGIHRSDLDGLQATRIIDTGEHRRCGSLRGFQHHCESSLAPRRHLPEGNNSVIWFWIGQ